MLISRDGRSILTHGNKSRHDQETPVEEPTSIFHSKHGNRDLLVQAREKLAHAAGTNASAPVRHHLIPLHHCSLGEFAPARIIPSHAVRVESQQIVPFTESRLSRTSESVLRACAGLFTCCFVHQGGQVGQARLAKAISASDTISRGDGRHLGEDGIKEGCDVPSFETAGSVTARRRLRNMSCLQVCGGAGWVGSSGRGLVKCCGS